MSPQIDPKHVTNSTKSFFTAAVANSALLLVEVGLFLLLKQRLERIYSPRTYLPPPDKQSTKLPSGPWKWLPAILNARAEDIIDKNGLDAYMFLRFLKMLVWIFLVFTVVTFFIIVPVDFIGQNGASSSLEKITWTNIVDATQKRFIAHIFVVYALTFYVIYLVRREMGHFVFMRQKWLLSPHHSRLAQARTVLITSVPDSLSTEPALRQFASFVPGGVERVWFYRDTKELNKLFEERTKMCAELEKAVAVVLRKAMKAWRKREEKRKKKKAKGIPKPRDMGGDGPLSDDEELLEQEPSQKLLDELVPPKKRPQHRPFGILGKKTDAIEWYKNEISKYNSEITFARTQCSEGKFLGSVFILCNLQIGAHILAQCVSYHEVLEMNDKFIETHPADIVWHNLDDNTLQTRSKVTLSWMATLALILVWSFPVAAVGGLSNVTSICSHVEWLSWICDAPSVVQSLIQGLLPPVLLAALFAVMPVILKGLAWYEGLPRYSLMSVSVYRRFFLFLLIHGFLIVTLSSGLTKVLEEIIDNPTSTVQKLAQNLPVASVFFLTYMLTQGLSGAGIALAQLSPLIRYYFGKWFLGRTPRQAFTVTFSMPSADFGTLLPRLSLLATIGLAYSVLNPLINFLALICYGCYYIAWKFLFLQVFNQPAARESGGGYFPMAVSNLFVGLYVEQICLASLFFLKISVSKFLAMAQGILMVVLLAITIWAHVLLNKSFAPLTKYIPMSLATQNLADRFGQTPGSDLFSKDFVESLRKRMGKMPDLGKLTRAGFAGSDSSSSALEAGDGSYSVNRNAKSTQAVESQPSFEVSTGPAENEGTGPGNSSTPDAAAEDQTAGTPEVPQPINADESLDSLNKYAFDHPSTYEPQPCIWIAKDPLGLSRVLVEYLEKDGVKASDVGATMSLKGMVEVTAPPPGQRHRD